MTALMIVGAVLLAVLLLLCARVSVEVFAAQGALTLRVRYLLLRFDITPGREKSARQRKRQDRRDAKKKQRDEKRKRKKEQKPAREKEKRTLREQLELVWGMLRGSRKGLGTLRRHLVISRVRVLVAAGAQDAHQTALLYGQIRLLAAAAIDVVGTLFVLKKPRVLIQPNFTAGHTRYEIALRAGIRPVFALAAGVRILIPLMGLLLGSQKRAAAAKDKQPLAKSA